MANPKKIIWKFMIDNPNPLFKIGLTIVKSNHNPIQTTCYGYMFFSPYNRDVHATVFPDPHSNPYKIYEIDKMDFIMK